MISIVPLATCFLVLVVLVGCAGKGDSPQPAPSVSVSTATSGPAANPGLGQSGALASVQSLPSSKGAPATVAVADFEGGSIPPAKQTEFWGRALASFMIADMSAAQNLRMIDRTHLADVLKEHEISATELADPATRLRTGKILGAKYFIFGTYSITGDEAALTAQMDSVESGEILEADSVSGDERDMRTLSQQLAAKFLQPVDKLVADQEMHSPAIPGGPSAEAVQDFDRGLAYKASGDYDHAIAMFTQALTIYPQYSAARSELENASEEAARQQ